MAVGAGVLDRVGRGVSDCIGRGVSETRGSGRVVVSTAVEVVDSMSEVGVAVEGVQPPNSTIAAKRKRANLC